MELNACNRIHREYTHTVVCEVDDSSDAIDFSLLPLFFLIAGCIILTLLRYLGEEAAAEC